MKRRALLAIFVVVLLAGAYSLVSASGVAMENAIRIKSTNILPWLDLG